MSVIDLIVDRAFRNEKEGRVVVFDGAGRGRGYLLRSTGDEQRIRAFLRMYVFAEFAIMLLGTLLVAAWLSSALGATGTPTLERELLRGGLFLGGYAVVVGLPFFLLWRAYCHAVPSFAGSKEVVPVTPRPMDRAQRIALAFLAVLAVAVAFAILAAGAHSLVRPHAP